MTLEQAQIAKIDLALGKLGLQPGMMLLDVGCGWGSAMLRALEKYDVNVVGLTLSKNQVAYVEQLLAASDSPRFKRVLLEGWEQFHEPVDRIVAIGPLEHFGYDRYAAFFQRAYDLLPGDGTMLLHTITSVEHRGERGAQTAGNDAASAFLQIHHGRDLPRRPAADGGTIEEHATKVGFRISRIQRLQPHYARTLDVWAAGLAARRDEAIAIQSEEVYDRYMKYLTGCAELFRDGYTDLCQFTLEKRTGNQEPLITGTGPSQL